VEILFFLLRVPSLIALFLDFYRGKWRLISTSLFQLFQRNSDIACTFVWAWKLVFEVREGRMQGRCIRNRHKWSAGGWIIAELGDLVAGTLYYYYTHYWAEWDCWNIRNACLVLVTCPLKQGYDRRFWCAWCGITRQASRVRVTIVALEK